MADYVRAIAEHRDSSPSAAGTPVFYERKPAKRKKAKKKSVARKLTATRKPKHTSTRKVKSVRVRKRAVAPQEAPMAKKGKRKGGKRKSGKLKGKAKAAFLRRMAKGRKRGKRSGNTAVAVAMERKPRKRRKSRRKGVARRSKSPTIATRSVSRRSGRRRKTQITTTIASERRRSGRRRSSHRRGAMENPMGWGEVLTGTIVGSVMFVIADGTDRFLATIGGGLRDKNLNPKPGDSAVVDKTQPAFADDGHVYGPAGVTVKNGVAIEAPMNLLRWGVGLGVPIVGFTMAHFVKAPHGRAALQFGSFAWGVRIVGKGLVDGIAFLMKKTAIGQRLYAPQLEAMAIVNPAGGVGSLPNGTPKVGLAAAQGANHNCPQCAQKAAQQRGVAGAPNGYPSVNAGNMPPPPPPPPQMQAPAPRVYGGPNAPPRPAEQTTTIAGGPGAPVRFIPPAPSRRERHAA